MAKDIDILRDKCQRELSDKISKYGDMMSKSSEEFVQLQLKKLRKEALRENSDAVSKEIAQKEKQLEQYREKFQQCCDLRDIIQKTSDSPRHREDNKVALTSLKKALEDSSHPIREVSGSNIFSQLYDAICKFFRVDSANILKTKLEVATKPDVKDSGRKNTKIELFINVLGDKITDLERKDNRTEQENIALYGIKAAKATIEDRYKAWKGGHITDNALEDRCKRTAMTLLDNRTIKKMELSDTLKDFVTNKDIETLIKGLEVRIETLKNDVSTQLGPRGKAKILDELTHAKSQIENEYKAWQSGRIDNDELKNCSKKEVDNLLKIGAIQSQFTQLKEFLENTSSKLGATIKSNKTEVKEQHSGLNYKM